MAQAAAGGVVFRRTKGELQFLMVTAKRTPSRWIFPKGHVEKGETSAHAAAREVAEEAGVHGLVLDRLDEIAYWVGSEMIRVEFFLIEYRGEVRQMDDRKVRWSNYDTALKSLSFAEPRRILELAWSRLQAT